jgi:hypothetical protein
VRRVVGNWGISLSDRLVRFVGVSTILQVLWAPVTVYLWRDLVVSGDAAEGLIPLWVWPIAIAYVALPVMLGTAVGRGTRRRARWSRVFTGPSPAPRAWDHLFASRPDGWIRLRLKEGTWLGGALSGAFLFDDAGQIRMASGGILIRWDEVLYLEFVDA